MTWLLIALFVVVALAIVGWCCCAVSGDIAQQEEDRYGVDEARRS